MGLANLIIFKAMKILLRSPNWIGDAVLSTSALSYLREKVSEAHITVLAKDWVRDIFLHHPSVDKTISFNRVRVALIRDIRRAEYNTGILFTNSFSSAFPFFTARIKRRVGYDTNARGFLLTERIPVPEDLEKIHQRDYYLHLVRILVPGDEVPEAQLYLAREEEEKASSILESVGIKGDRKIVGINPGASYGPSKRWPQEKFASLARGIIEKYKAEILIFGNRSEEKLGEVLIKGIEKDAVNLIGRTTLRELMALVKRCSLFITNDTGPMHIASALNVPVVAIFGPTDPVRTSPLGVSTVIRKEVNCSPCRYRSCPLNHECMERITVEEVLESTGKYLLTENEDLC